MLLQVLLSCRECRGRCWRGAPGDHRALNHPGRRTWSRTSDSGRQSLARGSNRRRYDCCGPEACWIYLPNRNGRLSHRAATRERTLRHRHYRARSSRINELLVVHGVIHVNRVVDICDVRLRDPGIGDVDVIEVPLANDVRRRIGFTKSKWNPSEARSSSKGNGHAKMRTAEPSHQGRCVVRPHDWSSV